MQNQKRVNFWLDKDLFKEFTMKCVELEVKKSEVLRMLIQKWLAGECGGAGESESKKGADPKAKKLIDGVIETLEKKAGKTNGDIVISKGAYEIILRKLKELKEILG